MIAARIQLAAAILADACGLIVCAAVLGILGWLLWSAIVEKDTGLSRWGTLGVLIAMAGLGWTGGRLVLLIAAGFGWV